ncbi:hypothetical protein LZK73_18690 [Neorhizobium galegae]|nr:hypothetical protein LZK73_18690 [Neorhizobium galegae]
MTNDQALTEITRVGTGMANILFNVSQNEALPIDVRESMKDQQRQWDAARAALQSTADTPPPSTLVSGPQRRAKYEKVLSGIIDEYEQRRDVLVADPEAKARFLILRSFELATATEDGR